jgi:alkanesulfonate monooxygenase SsuD/methylene tetrahydromethanopterin reductase-like flavin-dependent oxidoreductase (luciferase family)
VDIFRSIAMTIPVGLSIRNMGVESTPQLMRHCAVEAEKAGLASIWITDHIAIPPDEAEGSGGL